jgi:hypothetical protein
MSTISGTAISLPAVLIFIICTPFLFMHKNLSFSSVFYIPKLTRKSVTAITNKKLILFSYNTSYFFCFNDMTVASDIPCPFINAHLFGRMLRFVDIDCPRLYACRGICLGHYPAWSCKCAACCQCYKNHRNCKKPSYCFNVHDMCPPCFFVFKGAHLCAPVQALVVVVVIVVVAVIIVVVIAVVVVISVARAIAAVACRV